MAHPTQTQTQGRRLGIRMGSQERWNLENTARGPVRFPWECLVALGSSGSWSKQPWWRAKLNNHSLLKSAEAAPSGEVLGIGYSICPSRVWLNWKCMELHFFFLMEVNSCLTILPSDVFSRELGKQTTAWGMQPEQRNALLRLCFQHSLLSH